MFTVGLVAENCFVFRRDGSDRALIVDPGDEAERILTPVEELGLTVEAILLTHTHFDHVGAVAPVAKATGAPVALATGATAPTWSKCVCVSRIASSVTPRSSIAPSSFAASSPGSIMTACVASLSRRSR